MSGRRRSARAREASIGRTEVGAAGVRAVRDALALHPVAPGLLAALERIVEIPLRKLVASITRIEPRAGEGPEQRQRDVEAALAFHDESFKAAPRARRFRPRREHAAPQ